MNCTRFGCLCLLSLLATIARGGAGEAEFKVGVRDEEIPEAGMVTYTTVTTAVNEFVFLPPPRWRREIDARAGTILITSPDYRSTIRVLVPEPKGEETPTLKADDLRRALLQELAGASIVEESPSYTSGLSGLSFELERTVDNALKVRHREAFFAVAGGTVRITLAAPADQFTERQSDLSRLLNSFRTQRRKS